MGNAVSVNASFNANYNFGTDGANLGCTATATTNLMSFASLTAGRMALNFGSGRIIGSNDWNNDGNTWDGMCLVSITMLISRDMQALTWKVLRRKL